MNKINGTLINCDENTYGNNYKNHILEQYKLYVEMADRISSRRQSANSYFLTINTSVIAVSSYIQLGQTQNEYFYTLIGIAGMILCYTWYRLILSYKDLNSGKFKVIHSLEQLLPTAPYDAEWESLDRGENPKIYHPFTKIEMIVPWVFFTLHFLVFLQLIPLSKLFSFIKLYISV